MKIRDVERPTTFVKANKVNCKFYEMQGICTDSNGNYTCVVEALDMENDPFSDWVKAFTANQLFAKACFGQALGVDFVLMVREKNNGNKIHLITFRPNQNTKKAVLVSDVVKDEVDFLVWWKGKKASKQTKAYATTYMQNAINNSYFDTLFENNGSSWPLNIDGFTMDVDSNGNSFVSGLIENKISTSMSLAKYDPSRFAQADKRQWDTLIALSNRLGLPLYLHTYTRSPEESNTVGVALVRGINSNGLVYEKGISPNKNLFNNSQNLLNWMSVNK